MFPTPVAPILKETPLLVPVVNVTLKLIGLRVMNPRVVLPVRSLSALLHLGSKLWPVLQPKVSFTDEVEESIPRLVSRVQWQCGMTLSALAYVLLLLWTIALPIPQQLLLGIAKATIDAQQLPFTILQLKFL